MNGLATRTPASDLERVDTWTGLADAALRRRATTAANSRDADELWGLLEAYQTAERGGLASSHTRRSYRTGLRVLLEAWEGENLLRPSPRAGENYRLALGRRLGPASVNLRLAAARALYRALRWSRATEADPFRDLSQVHDPVAPEDKCQPYSFWDPAAGEGETLRRSERDQAELEQLLDAAGHPADLVVILLGAHAGLRRSEMEALSALRASGENRRRGYYVLPWTASRASQRFTALCRQLGSRRGGYTRSGTQLGPDSTSRAVTSSWCATTSATPTLRPPGSTQPAALGRRGRRCRGGEASPLARSRRLPGVESSVSGVPD